MGLDRQERLARDDAEVGGIDARALLQRGGHVCDRAVGATVARMSNPPPYVPMSFRPFTNDVVVVAPVTSVKTTSVNIARVTPVRNRFRSG